MTSKSKSKPLIKASRQRMDKFCLAYIESGNGTQAAITAGCPEKSARFAASRWLARKDVQARIAELRQKTEDATIATVVERKQVLTEIIRGRVNQFTEGNYISVTADRLNSAAVAEVTTSEIKLGRGEDAALVEITKLKLRDPIAAIDLMNKMDKIYSDGAQVNIDNRTLNIIVKSDADKAALEEATKRLS